MSKYTVLSQRMLEYARVCQSIPRYAKVLQYFIDDVDLVLDDNLNQVVHVFNDHDDEGLSVNDEVVSLLILALTR